VAAGQKLQHSLAQLFRVRPEGETEVRVKAEDGPGLPGGSNGRQMGVPHGTIHQGDAAEMQGKGLPEPLPPDLIRPVQKVCGGFAVKAEGAVSVLLQADKGQGGVGLVRKGDVAHVHAVTGQLLNDLVAKGVLPQLGQKCALTAQTGKCAADIGRCSPYPGAERGDLPKGTACPGGNHVDQCFTNGKKGRTGHFSLLLV